MMWPRKRGVGAARAWLVAAAMVALGAAACGADDDSSTPQGGGGAAVGGGGSGGSGGAAGGHGGSSSGGAAGGGGGGGESLPYECPPDLNPCPAFPGTSWPSATAAEVGLDETGIDAFVNATGNHQGVITRYGYLVRSWGGNGKFGWASASKPVFATLLMFAVQEGLLSSVDDLVGDWGWSLSSADQAMTFRHLANMMSGYALPEGPGEAWAYNDYAIKLYALTLFEHVFTDGTADQVAKQPGRLGPLAFEDGDLFAVVKGAPRITTSPRDFSRIGWLWANGGVWDGQALLAPGTLSAYMKPGVPASLPRTAGGLDDYLGLGTSGGGTDQTGLGPGIYGFNWWFNPGGQTWPAAPGDTVQANGHWNGEVLTVIPSEGIVAAWKGNGTDPETFDQPMNDILKALTDAVLP